MKEIPLTQGQVTLVDDEDYEWLNQWKWCAQWHATGRRWYAVRGTWINGKHHLILMHRAIVAAQRGQQVDHANHQTLDNQRGNLRPCNNSQNQGNRRHNTKATAPYKGICWYKSRSKWVAGISADNKRVHLGYFATAVEAARAYDTAAKTYFGEFALINGV